MQTGMIFKKTFVPWATQVGAWVKRLEDFGSYVQ